MLKIGERMPGPESIVEETPSWLVIDAQAKIVFKTDFGCLDLRLMGLGGSTLTGGSARRLVVCKRVELSQMSGRLQV